MSNINNSLKDSESEVSYQSVVNTRATMGENEKKSCNCCFMTKFVGKDIKRGKCNFCLAFCSVFFVVLSTLIINTVTGFGPIIFLRLGE